MVKTSSPSFTNISSEVVSENMRRSVSCSSKTLRLVLPLPLALGEKKRRAAAITIGCGLATAFFAILLLPGLPGMLGEAHEILQGRAEDEFGSGRVFIWKNVWQAVKERPLFGMYYCSASLCCFALFVLWCWFAANWRCSPMLFAV